eukprot:3640457-Rhodomonas_salina.2
MHARTEAGLTCASTSTTSQTCPSTLSSRASSDRICAHARPQLEPSEASAHSQVDNDAAKACPEGRVAALRALAGEVVACAHALDNHGRGVGVKGVEEGGEMRALLEDHSLAAEVRHPRHVVVVQHARLRNRLPARTQSETGRWREGQLRSGSRGSEIERDQGPSGVEVRVRGAKEQNKGCGKRE